MLIKQGVHHLPETEQIGEYFWQIASNALNKGKSTIPCLFNGLQVLSSASNKAKLFAENFSKNSNLDESEITLYLFSLLELI